MRKLLVIPRVQDWMNLVMGSALFLTPWVLSFTDLGLAAWNAWLCGGVVACVALVALIAYEPWEQWHGVAIGLWLMLAPWVLGFTAAVGAVAAHVILGAMILASEAWEIWHLRRQRGEMAYQR